MKCPYLQHFLSLVDDDDLDTGIWSHSKLALGMAEEIRRILAERDALLAEHEAVKPAIEWGRFSDTEWDTALIAHDNAERVIHGE